MRRWLIACVLLLGGCGAQPIMLTPQELGSEPTMHALDPAPPLRVSEWIKGSPVRAYEPGMIYVVDVWASWCAPCRASVERLSQLQDKHKGKVVVVGVSYPHRNNSRSDIREAAAEDDPWVRFAQAIDDERATAEAFQRPLRENAFPRSFVVDAKGRFVWVEHPVEVGKFVDDLVAGMTDEEIARRWREYRQAVQALKSAKNDVFAASGDARAELNAVERILSHDPARVGDPTALNYAARRVELTARLGLKDQAVLAADQLAAISGTQFDPSALARGAIALATLDPGRAEQLGLKAEAMLRAHEAVDTKPPSDLWDRYIHEAEARTRFHSCDWIASWRASRKEYSVAVEWQRKAVAEMPPWYGKLQRDRLSESLKRYEAAAGR